MSISFQPLSPAETHDVVKLKAAYGQFWRNAKFTKGHQEPFCARSDAEKAISEAAEIVVRLRTHLDQQQPFVDKKRVLAGSSRDFLFGLNESTFNPSTFARDLVHATVQDLHGYVEGLSEQAVDDFIGAVRAHHASKQSESDTIQRQCEALYAQVVTQLGRNEELFEQAIPSDEHDRQACYDASMRPLLDTLVKQLADVESTLRSVRLNRMRLTRSPFLDAPGTPFLHRDEHDLQPAPPRTPTDSTSSSQPTTIEQNCPNEEAANRDEQPTASDPVANVSDDQSTVISDDQSTVISDDQSTVASDDQSTVASDDQSTVASDDQSTVASDDQSTVASDDQSTVASDNQSTVSSDDHQSTATSGASDDQSTVASDDQSIAADDQPSASDEQTDDEESSAANKEAIIVIEKVAHHVDQLASEFRGILGEVEPLCADEEALRRRPIESLKKIEGLHSTVVGYSEELLNDLLRLDDLEVDPKARAERKKQVNEIQALMDDLDRSAAKLKSISKTLKAEVQKVKESSPPASPTPPDQPVAADTTPSKTAQPQQPQQPQQPSAASSSSSSPPSKPGSPMQSIWEKMKLELQWDKDATARSYFIRTMVPGLDTRNIKLELADDNSTFTISGCRTPTAREEQELRQFVRRRYRYDPAEENAILLRFASGKYGLFRNTFSLPADALPDKIRASYDRGILQIEVPRQPVPVSHHRPQQFAPAHGRRGYPGHHGAFFNDRDLWW